MLLHKLSLLDPDPYTLEEHSRMDNETLEDFGGNLTEAATHGNTLSSAMVLDFVLEHVDPTRTPRNPKWNRVMLIRLLRSNKDFCAMMDEAIEKRQFSTIRSLCQ